MNGGHTPWKGVTPMGEPHQREVQMGYVDGYALCCDDLLRELSQLEQRRNWDPDTRTLVRQLRQMIHNLRSGAQQTMKMLRELKNERFEVSAEAELGEGLRGDLGGLPGQSPLQGPAPE